MVTTLRPNRGGFIRPFGCAWFIREFLAGHAPEGSSTIDPDIGSPQTDINYQYKSALVRAIARDNAERIISDMVLAGKEVTEEKADEIYQAQLKKVPHKYTRMRYHSFLIYFGMLKRLEWVEETGKTEASEIQDNYPPGPSRTFYRLTGKGRSAADAEWSNPQLVLYPETFLRHHPRHATV